MSVPRAAPEGGGPKEPQMLNAAMSESAFVIHSPPDFDYGAEILGVCGVSAENSDQYKYGWMVADFLRWKTLFSGAVDPRFQTWLSSLDIRKFLADVDGVDMDDGAIDQIMGGRQSHIVQIPSDNKAFVEAFLRRLADSAWNALSHNATLVIIVFAPITPEQDICVDLGGKKEYLELERLRQTLDREVGEGKLSVVLVTPSPFTGGWLCRPSFMNPRGEQSPYGLWRIVAKSCGGAFAEHFIRTFTRRNTPMMAEAQRKKVEFDDPMPLGPTQLQVNALHSFQREIHAALEQRLSGCALDHSFILDKVDGEPLPGFTDSWTEYAPRQGRQLSVWADNWKPGRLTVEGADRFEWLGQAFGGTKRSQIFHLGYLAAVEMDTCPGDWELPALKSTRHLFRDFTQKWYPSEDDAKRVFDAIEFRASSMVLAQTIAKAFGLPLPNGERCRYWDNASALTGEAGKKFSDTWRETKDLFGQVAVLPGETPHDFKALRFWRPSRWLAAAIALRFANGTQADVDNFLRKDVAPFVAKIKDLQSAMLLEHRSVRLAGQNWIDSIGLDARD